MFDTIGIDTVAVIKNLEQSFNTFDAHFSNLNLLSLEQRDWQPNLSIKDNEKGEGRLFNQRQYQKENIKNGLVDHIR